LVTDFSDTACLVLFAPLRAAAACFTDAFGSGFRSFSSAVLAPSFFSLTWTLSAEAS
jgi:hypothetical protein